MTARVVNQLLIKVHKILKKLSTLRRKTLLHKSLTLSSYNPWLKEIIGLILHQKYLF